MMTQGTLDILPPEAERLRTRHLADAIPAESFAAGANPVATLENVNLEGFIGENEDWPLCEGGDGINATGLELIAAKVKELRIMVGCFDPASAPDGTNGAEYNAARDPLATKRVLEQWPSPVVVSPWEVGLKLHCQPEDVLADYPPGTQNPAIRVFYET